MNTDASAPRQDGDTLDIHGIMKMIPHRVPMLMVDRVEDVVPHQSATGIKNITMNEPYFLGHFPGQPVMPGVMIIESMAQTSAVLVMHSLGAAAHGRLVYFMSIDHARFRRPVTPGDQLRLHVARDRVRGNVWRFHGKARVDGALVAEATYAAMIMDS